MGAPLTDERIASLGTAVEVVVILELVDCVPSTCKLGRRNSDRQFTVQRVISKVPLRIRHDLDDLYDRPLRPARRDFLFRVHRRRDQVRWHQHRDGWIRQLDHVGDGADHVCPGLTCHSVPSDAVLSPGQGS